MSITTGYYSHHRRRAWDRDRRALAIVFFIPGVDEAWQEWRRQCAPLFQLRAVSRLLSHTVCNAEQKHGDIFASYSAVAWLHYIAYQINELETELWDDWNMDHRRTGQSLWEYKSDANDEGTIWDTYDWEHGFPKQDSPGGLQMRLLRERERITYTVSAPIQRGPVIGPEGRRAELVSRNHARSRYPFSQAELASFDPERQPKSEQWLEKHGLTQAPGEVPKPKRPPPLPSGPKEQAKPKPKPKSPNPPPGLTRPDVTLDTTGSPLTENTDDVYNRNLEGMEADAQVSEEEQDEAAQGDCGMFRETMEEFPNSWND